MTGSSTEPKKKKKKSLASRLIWLIPISMFVLFLYTGSRFLREYREYKAARDEYSTLSSLIADAGPENAGTGSSSGSGTGGLSGLLGNTVSAGDIARKLESLEMESADALDLDAYTNAAGSGSDGYGETAAGSSDPAEAGGTDAGDSAVHSEGDGNNGSTAGAAADASAAAGAADTTAAGAADTAAAGASAATAGDAADAGNSNSGTGSAASASAGNKGTAAGTAGKTNVIVYPRLQIDFDALKEINEDFVGVLYIPFLDIKYPIAHSHDNKEYLRRTFEGTTNAAGCIFLEAFASEDLTDTNTFIFGHNMRDRSMFGSFNTLETDAELCPQHPYFYIYMPGIVYKYSVFAYGPVSVEDPLYSFFDAKDDPKAYDAFIRKSAARSIYTPEEGSIDFSGRPNLVTLSTCYGTGHINNFVIQGALKGAAPLRGSVRRAEDKNN